MATPTSWMPFFGEHTAPTFNPAFPNDLPRFFARLETLFDHCNVRTDPEKKTYATSYIDCELAECWEALPEFFDASKTYSDFRDCLLYFYNQDSCKYTRADLDRVVIEHLRTGFHCLADLSNFHLQFNAIASFLLSINLLSLREQSQAYFRAFDTAMSSRISLRLQIKLPDRLPSLPYTIDEIYDAAHWVLLDILIRLSSPNSIPPSTSTPSQIALFEPSETHELSKTSNFAHSPSPAYASSDRSLISSPDFESSSWNEMDNHLTALEAELSILRAQIDSPAVNPTQDNNFAVSSDSLLFTLISSTHPSILSPQPSIPSLQPSIHPIFMQTSNHIYSDIPLSPPGLPSPRQACFKPHFEFFKPSQDPETFDTPPNSVFAPSSHNIEASMFTTSLMPVTPSLTTPLMISTVSNNVSSISTDVLAILNNISSVSSDIPDVSNNISTASIKSVTSSDSGQTSIASDFLHFILDPIALGLLSILAVFHFVFQKQHGLPSKNSCLPFVLLLLPLFLAQFVSFKHYRYHLWPNKRSLRHLSAFVHSFFDFRVLTSILCREFRFWYHFDPLLIYSFALTHLLVFYLLFDIFSLWIWVSNLWQFRCLFDFPSISLRIRFEKIAIRSQWLRTVSISVTVGMIRSECLWAQKFAFRHLFDRLSFLFYWTHVLHT